MKDKIKHSKELAQSIADINITNKLPIDIETQDEILDDINPVQGLNEDVKIKEPISFNAEYTLSQLEKHVFILARVFRSLSLIDDLAQMNDTFELIITSYINLGFEFLNEIDFVKEKSEKDIEKKIISVLTSFIPLVTQLMIADAVLHKNLTRFLKKKIEELEKNKKDNQYKLMIFYFMLLDTDLKTNQEVIEKIIENINLLSLKNISIVKLLYYLLFKSNDNKQLEKFLKEKIVAIQLNLNPKADKGKLINNINREILMKAIK